MKNKDTVCPALVSVRVCNQASVHNTHTVTTQSTNAEPVAAERVASILLPLLSPARLETREILPQVPSFLVLRIELTAQTTGSAWIEMALCMMGQHLAAFPIPVCHLSLFTLKL